jgi:hypothetical protein
MITKEEVSQMLENLTPETLAGWWIHTENEFDYFKLVTKVSFLIPDATDKPIFVIAPGVKLELGRFLETYRPATDTDVRDILHSSVIFRT